MLTVTDRAKETLARLKATTAGLDDAEAGLRLLLASGDMQFGLQMDYSKPGDQVVEHAGVKVLLVDEALADALTDATIDADSVGGGDDLVIRRPRTDRPGGAT
jgi:Fe-S cluster assembly iron-binding protein IscA